MLALELFLQTIMIINVKSSNPTSIAANIANAVFDPNRVTAVVWGCSDQDDVTDFLKNFHGSVVAAPIQHGTPEDIRETYKTVKYRQVVIIAAVVDEFEYFSTTVHKDVVTPYRAILILSTPLPEHTEQSELTRATKAAWDNDIGDIIVLSTNIGDENVKLSTYMPYGNGECGNYTAVTLDTAAGSYFPRKFSSFYGCPIKVIISDYAMPHAYLMKLQVNTINNNVVSIGGVDGEMLSFIFEKLNAVLDIVALLDTDNIENIINGSITGVFVDIINGRGDIFLPPIKMSPEKLAVSQISPVYFFIPIYWVAPKPREIYAWAKTLLPFVNGISPYILLSFLVFTAVIKMVRRFSPYKPEKQKGVFFQAFLLFLGQVYDFETKCWLVNSLFTMWIWFCLIMRVAYQGELVDGLQKVILEPRIRTIEDSIKVVEGYIGTIIHRNYYKSSPEVYNRYHIIKVNEIPYYVKEIANGKRFLMTVGIFAIELQREKISILDELVNIYFTCLHMRPGWPAATEVQITILDILATGLHEKVVSDYTYQWNLK